MKNFHITYIKTSNSTEKVESFQTELEADTRAAVLLNTDDTLDIYLSAPICRYQAKKFVKIPFIIS